MHLDPTKVEEPLVRSGADGRHPAGDTTVDHLGALHRDNL